MIAPGPPEHRVRPRRAVSAAALALVVSTFLLYAAQRTGASSLTSGSCTLSGGEAVLDGWHGKDTGANECNSCFCDKGRMACTRMACAAHLPTEGLAQQGETCDGFDETTGKAFPSCAQGLVCLSVDEMVSVPGAGKKCTPVADTVTERRFGRFGRRPGGGLAVGMMGGMLLGSAMSQRPTTVVYEAPQQPCPYGRYSPACKNWGSGNAPAYEPGTTGPSQNNPLYGIAG